MPRSWARRVDPVVRDWWPVILVLALSQLPTGAVSRLHPLAATALALLAAVPLRWRRERPAVTVVAVAVAPMIHVAVSGTDPPFATFVALLIAAVALGQQASLKGALALLAVVGAMVTVFVLGPPAPAADLVIPIVYFGGAWGLGRVLRQRQQTAARMAALLQALEQERDAKARLAAEAERHHIAREVHDVVAHSLGVIAVHAEAAEELLDRGTGDVREPLAVIRDTTRHALEELRGVLSTVRAHEPSPSVGLGALRELVAQSGGLGVEVTLDMDDPEPDRLLPATVEATAYRVVQEALTNAARHAPGADVHVSVRVDGELLRVMVRDKGGGRDHPTDPGPGGGYGLAGMRERVARLGGRLTAGEVEGGGFCVEAQLPISVAAR